MWGSVCIPAHNTQPIHSQRHRRSKTMQHDALWRQRTVCAKELWFWWLPAPQPEQLSHREEGREISECRSARHGWPHSPRWAVHLPVLRRPELLAQENIPNPQSRDGLPGVVHLIDYYPNILFDCFLVTNLILKITCSKITTQNLRNIFTLLCRYTQLRPISSQTQNQANLPHFLSLVASYVSH